MGSFAHADGGVPWLVNEAVPGEAATAEDIVVEPEDTISEPVLAHELPDVLHRIEFGAFRRKRQQRDVLGHDQSIRAVPSSLIEQQHSMRALPHQQERSIVNPIIPRFPAVRLAGSRYEPG